VEHPEVRLRWIAADELAPRDGELAMGLEFVTRPGWHVYWKNPGDAGFPMRVESGSPELTDLEVAFPAPHRYRLPGDLQALGYEGAVVYPLQGRLRVAPEAERVALRLSVDFLVCEIECIPYHDEPGLDLGVATERRSDEEVSVLLEGWRRRVPGSPDGVVRLDATLEGAPEEPVARFLFEGEAPDTDLFLEAHPAVDFGIPERSSTPGGLRFDVALRPKERRPEGLRDLELAWTLTGLSGDRAVASSVRLETPRSPSPGRTRRLVILGSMAAATLLFLLLRRWRTNP
jgi:DsbC/DsbD-like thiol-disulfide interchange protein